MIRRSILVLLAPTLLFAGLRLKKPHAEPAPSPLDQYIKENDSRQAEASRPANGSIWSQDARYSGLAMDLRASHLDDIVTIVVAEKASALSSGNTATARSSSAKASITGMLGVPHATGPLPNLAKTASDVQLDGKGTTARTTTLSTSLSARVTRVLQNGNLVVEGAKNVSVNSETQVVTVRGVVRPIDLDSMNTITSDRLAQLEVRINGKGVVGDAIRRPNILYRILLGLLPF